jgi:putative OPT family oligopeptide transporter
MADVQQSNASSKNKPLVPAEMNMKEFTLKAVLLGLIMCIVLGAANAYLGLKAGMTIAATYPAAVIGMAILRVLKGNILEENMARTVGSIGESVAAGAIFTIPAFLISGVWDNNHFMSVQGYLESAAIMFVGGTAGIMFVTMLRRVMVEDTELPFPESVAAAEIHKAGRSGGTGASYLFLAMGFGGLVQLLAKFNFFAASWEKFIMFAKSTITLKTGSGTVITQVPGSGGALITAPAVSPAYIGVGYIIGPRLASLNFAGGVLAWGLFVPLLLYILGPSLETAMVGPNGQSLEWAVIATAIWKLIVRPIAIGGMLVSAGYTLFKMRKNLALGLSRSISDVKKAAAGGHHIERTEKDLNLKIVGLILVGVGIATFLLYYYFSSDVVAAIVATIVMLIAGFFFAAVSGYLVGLIGSSNNPISGLTISTLIIAAILMVALGVKGTSGVAAVLGVAAVICVSSAVAGEMLQDLKVGHILGGTPWKMQMGDLIGVAFASLLLFFPLLILHQGDINSGGTGFGGKSLAAPQAGLMAMLSQGIVGGQMQWPLVIVGMLMGVGFILVQVKSPMLVSVGMYLPFETTAAIFVGGLIKGIVDKVAARKKFNDAQKARSENNGVLLASGLIAGEALMGLVFAALAFFKVEFWTITDNPSFYISIGIFLLIGWILVRFPVKNAGDPDEPAPPSAIF